LERRNDAGIHRQFGDEGDACDLIPKGAPHGGPGVLILTDRGR
jgi:hypothetical protein